MLVLGIDPGLVTTGYGLVVQKKGRFEGVKYGTIKPPAKRPIAMRLNYLFENITVLIEQHKPDILSVEDTFYGKNIKTALLLGQARGAIILAGARQNLACFEYSPRKVKQSVTGNGAATKEQVQFMIKSILGLRELPAPIDASDALALAVCHHNQNSGAGL